MVKGNPSRGRDPVLFEDILEMAGSIYASAILKACIELDIFTKIAVGSDSVERMASSIEASERGVRILLDAICTLRIVAKEEEKYSLTPTANQFLVKGKDSYMGDAVLNILRDWEAFGKLAEAVKKGKPVVDIYGPQSKSWEEVSIGLTSSGLATASIICDVLGINKKMEAGINVLDLACGSGVYGYVLLQRDPKATLTDIDWENVLKVAIRVAHDMGVAGRVTFKPGDVLSIDYGKEEFDIAIVSNILQSFDPETNKMILGKIYKALKLGGTLVINDVVPDEKRTKARMAINFAVYMLVVSKGGDAYTLSEFEGWLKDTGFENVVEHRIPLPTSLIIANKRVFS